MIEIRTETRMIITLDDETAQVFREALALWYQDYHRAGYKKYYLGKQHSDLLSDLALTLAADESNT